MVKYSKWFIVTDRRCNMNKMVETFKNMYLDSISMGRGFIYGFILVGLLILIGGTLLYGILFLRNLIF